MIPRRLGAVQLSFDTIKADAPRSYYVESPDGSLLRRNRRNLQTIPAPVGDKPADTPQGLVPPSPSPPSLPPTSPQVVQQPTEEGSFQPKPEGVTRSGRVVKPVKRLDL